MLFRSGVVPIRGHSGVQGGAEVGAVPDQLPGGAAVSNPESVERFSQLWGFDVPEAPGMRAASMIDAAYDGDLDVLYCSGGNFLEKSPVEDIADVISGITKGRIRESAFGQE